MKVAKVDLTSNDTKITIFAFALSTTLSMSDAERQHAVNKSYNSASGAGALFHQLAAHSVNSNAQSNLNKSLRICRIALEIRTLKKSCGDRH
jgi:hypothetical protein